MLLVGPVLPHILHTPHLSSSTMARNLSLSTRPTGSPRASIAAALAASANTRDVAALTGSARRRMVWDLDGLTSVKGDGGGTVAGRQYSVMGRYVNRLWDSKCT